MAEISQRFVTELTENQPRILAYILSLLADANSAQDVLQETNLTMWRRADSFHADAPFLPWALKIAYFHVLSHRRRSIKQPQIFSDEVLDFLAERHAERLSLDDDRSERLKRCLEKLPSEHRTLLLQRYAPGGSVQGLARDSGRTEAAVSQLLRRIRLNLLRCLQVLPWGEAS